MPVGREPKPKLCQLPNGYWRLTPAFAVAPDYDSHFVSVSPETVWHFWRRTVEQGSSGKYYPAFVVNFVYFDGRY